MQRICRDSLADCTASRRRRQMIRLKSIKRILEDLQKQIRSLRNASKEETPNRNTTIPSTTTTTPSASATSAPVPSTSSGPSTSGLDNPTAGPSTSAGKNCTYFFVKSIWLIDFTKKKNVIIIMLSSIFSVKITLKLFQDQLQLQHPLKPEIDNPHPQPRYNRWREWKQIRPKRTTTLRPV